MSAFKTGVGALQGMITGGLSSAAMSGVGNFIGNRFRGEEEGGSYGGAMLDGLKRGAALGALQGGTLFYLASKGVGLGTGGLSTLRKALSSGQTPIQRVDQGLNVARGLTDLGIGISHGMYGEDHARKIEDGRQALLDEWARVRGVEKTSSVDFDIFSQTRDLVWRYA